MIMMSGMQNTVIMHLHHYQEIGMKKFNVMTMHTVNLRGKQKKPTIKKWQYSTLQYLRMLLLRRAWG